MWSKIMVALTEKAKNEVDLNFERRNMTSDGISTELS